MTTGEQKTICERLKEIEAKVRDGAYGEADNVDLDAFREDLQDITADM